jgi:hypothetical protein
MKVKSDAFNAMDVQFSAGMHGRGVPPKERFIGDPQEYFNEKFRPNSPYHTVFERFASEGMVHFGNQRIEAEKFARWMETDYSLFFMVVEVRNPNDP